MGCSQGQKGPSQKPSKLPAAWLAGSQTGKQTGLSQFEGKSTRNSHTQQAAASNQGTTDHIWNQDCVCELEKRVWTKLGR